ncbi:alpha-ketoacid dehydrogenase subunit beta [Rhodococcus jostii]|uniref:Alpha-ketoacid dehydrogenase subunit beta n=1 Tax=Rhodococcus jostii TaxID=132919 RepID=A0ABU4CT98_RHOJO|nr:alpha-ketoacid dehydrogenase subunit beta [Rhodococcus jostii]MDV6286791.1 alpha-ketoacid dehydrogenase subunit beta [Rhodococcus jostii]
MTAVERPVASDRDVGTELSLSKALNRGLDNALARDPRVLVMGQDVGSLGGVFRVTEGLQDRFGDERVMDTTLAESGIVGTAIGLALRGYRPVCEIQFDGFVYPAFNQIVSQLAKLRARTLGQLTAPVVIRIPAGGGIGAVEHHSESNEAYFAHTAGLRVVSCATPDDAYWMIQEAIESDDPVVFFEPKRLYWRKGTIGPPRADPFASAVVRAGEAATIISYGGALPVALRAADELAHAGHRVEVIDLRALAPIDYGPLLASARKTGHVVIVHEAHTVGGLGSELATRIAEHCFYSLHAPVLRVGAYNLPYPPARIENEFLPDPARVVDAVTRSLNW